MKEKSKKKMEKEIKRKDIDCRVYFDCRFVILQKELEFLCEVHM